MKNKVLGLCPDLMKLNSQQLQSVCSSKEKALRISQLLWNETLVAAKFSSFANRSRKMIHIFMKYCKVYHRVFLYLTISVSCNSQPVRAQHDSARSTFYVQYIWQHLGFSLGIFTKINYYFSLEKTPLRHWKSPLVHTKTQLLWSFPLLFFSHHSYQYKTYSDK